MRVVYDPGALEVEVLNGPGEPGGERDGDGAGSGHGLIGMHERARLYGGTLEAVAEPGGGFRVRARLPLEAT